MDWGKQDNELRQLMDGADFLPDEEQWNSVAGWRKLQQKRQPAKKGLTGYGRHLVAAACMVGILGIGLWWLQQENSVGIIDSVVKSNEIEKKIGVKVDVIDQSNLYQNPTNTVNPEKENDSLNKESQSLNNGMKQISDESKLQSLVNSVPESKMLHNKEDETMVVIESQNEMDNNSVNAVVTSTSAQENKVDIVSAATVKKTKIRVVHYNELIGKHSTAPPVFVLTKKSEIEWESVAIQNATTQSSHPYSLKIDISPAPKKSL